MDERLEHHLAFDRRLAALEGRELPSLDHGAVLFADISDFSHITSALRRAQGPRQGAEELTRALDTVYGCLIREVHRYRGSIVVFSGDSLTCWFSADDGWRAVTAAVRMRESISTQWVTIAGQEAAPLAIKVGIAVGPTRRFAVGDPDVQRMDTLAGATVLEAAACEQHAKTGQVILTTETASQLGNRIESRTLGDAPAFHALESLLRDAPEAPWDLPGVLVPDEQARPWVLEPVREAIRAGQSSYLAELRLAVPAFVRFSAPDYDRTPDASALLDAYVRWVQRELRDLEGYLLGLTIGDKGSYLNLIFGAPVSHEDDTVRAATAAHVLLEPPSDLSRIQDIGIGICRGRMRAGTLGGETRRTYGVLGDHGNRAARLMMLAEPGSILVDEAVRSGAEPVFRFEFRERFRLKGKIAPIPVYRALGRREWDEVGAMGEDRGETSASARSAAFTTEESRAPIAGRHAECRIFSRALGDVANEDCRLLVVEGEAGIGKSRLLHEFDRQAQEEAYRVLRGGAESIERSSPYHVWRPVFMDLFGMRASSGDEEALRGRVLASLPLDDRLAKLAPLLEPVLPFEWPDNETTQHLAGEARADNTRDLLIRVLDAHLEQGNLCLMLEDLQWADSASLDLLRDVRRRLGGLLLVCSQRTRSDASEAVEHPAGSGAPYGNGAAVIHLTALTKAEIESVLCRRLGAESIDPWLLDFVHARSEGHPFYSEELTISLRDAGLVTSVNGQLRASRDRERLQSLDLPATIEGVITSRIDRLPAPAQLCLKVASVIGRTFDATMLQGVHPQSPDEATLSASLEELRAHGIVQRDASAPESSISFRHAITQRVGYDRMLSVQRSELHARAARWIEERNAADLDPWLPLVAFHYHRAELLPEALESFDRAASMALRQGAYREAMGFAESAEAIASGLEVEEEGGERPARRSRTVGEAQMGLGEITKARVALEEAMSLAGAPVPRSSLGLGAGIVRALLTQIAHRLRPAWWPVRRAGAETRAFLAATAYELLPNYYIGNHMGGMLYATLRSLNLAELAMRIPTARRVSAKLYSTMGLLAPAVGSQRLAAYYRRLSLATAETIEDPNTNGQVRNINGLAAMGSGNFEQAAADLRHALSYLRAANDARWWEITTGALAWLQTYRAQFRRGLSFWQECRESARRRGDQQSEGLALCGQAEFLLSLGEHDSLEACEALLAEAIQLLPTGNDRVFDLHVLGLQGELASRRYDMEGASAAFIEAARLMAQAPPLAGYALVVYARPAEGLFRLLERRSDAGSREVRDAAELAYRSLRKFARVFPAGRARSLRVGGIRDAQRGRRRRATQQWIASLEVAKRLQQPQDEAMAYYELARHEFTETGAARRVWKEAALEILESLGMCHELALAERTQI